MAAVSMTSFSSVTDAALKSGGVLPQASRSRTIARFAGLRTCPIRNERKANPLRGAVLSGSIRISCAVAAPATLETVISIIAKQLSLEASDVKAESQFSELGADSLDTVEIMMSLEENFDIVLGEEGAEKILTVQDAADLIEAGVHKGKSA
ncbi:hypothetical protein O6H91_19G039900 [Diphasiastrum complanatum]|uniref:Uncharacterized protein n=1 Tax=Diphasiastrum complanatum TaxID=34168 RepID=A0ACC2AUB6_DIPCM|nr:hypothetical protein O6H91_19G039900 [Diphasiastrum complanatum]